VARLIRKHTKKRVCCIGDGGNDVSMIQAADVGESLLTNNTTSPTEDYFPQVSVSSAKKANKLPSQPTSLSHSSAT
jgi:magnesium-transporting ATPase (P-type)